MSKTKKELRFVKKISSAKLGFGIKECREAAAKGKGKTVALYQVIGQANKIRTGMGDNGPWTAFCGMMEANTPDGEVVRSGEVFLPGGVSDMLESQLLNMQKEDPSAQIQFAFEIGVFESQTPIGYEFDVVSLMKEESSPDPLESLKKNLITAK